MKLSIVLLMLFLVGCGPEIRIADEVRVIDGFYKGCTGRVIKENHPIFSEYVVKLWCENRGVEIKTTQVISGSDLEVIK